MLNLMVAANRVEYNIFMKKISSRKLAQAIAKLEGWIAWIQTVERGYEGEKGMVIGVETSFKKLNPPPKCPHCHGALSYGEYKYTYVQPNIICWDEDETVAWKLLIDDYLQTKKLSMSELQMKLSVNGLI